MSDAKRLADAVNAAVGAGTIKMASDPSMEVTYTTTGLLPFDILLLGGIPSGRFIEIYGDPSTLKSWLALNCFREYQKLGRTVALIDTEHSFDPDWARQAGVNLDDLIIWPNRGDNEIHTGEEAIDAAQALVKGGVDFIAFDSVAAAFPQSEGDKRLKGESIQPARLAMLMSSGLRRLTATNSRTSILWVNQTRLNIGITFGSKEVNPGGKALPFYASYRIRMQKTGRITEDVRRYAGGKWVTSKRQVGQQFKCEMTKSKLSVPFGEVWFDYDLRGGGIDMSGFLIAQGLELGLVEQKGNTWHYVNGNLRKVGRDKFKDALQQDEQAMRDLESEIRRHHGLPVISPSPGRRAGRGRKKASAPKKLLRRR